MIQSLLVSLIPTMILITVSPDSGQLSIKPAKIITVKCS